MKKDDDDETEDKEGKDEENKEEKSDKQKPLPGNGGVGPTYYWSQTLDELTVNIPLPDNTTAK